MESAKDSRQSEVIKLETVGNTKTELGWTASLYRVQLRGGKSDRTDFAKSHQIVPKIHATERELNVETSKLSKIVIRVRKGHWRFGGGRRQARTGNREPLGLDRADIFPRKAHAPRSAYLGGGKLLGIFTAVFTLSWSIE